MERGESLAKAKQTFINTGYPPAEVAAAVQKLPTPSSQPATPSAPITPTPSGKLEKNPQVNNTIPTTQVIGTPKKKSKTLIIILIIIAALILVGAGLLGLFWDSLFGS